MRLDEVGAALRLKRLPVSEWDIVRDPRQYLAPPGPWTRRADDDQHARANDGPSHGAVVGAAPAREHASSDGRSPIRMT